MPFTIYALVDPRTDEVRYIGCTIQPLARRARAHFFERGNGRKSQWLQELRDAGLKPDVELLEEAEDEPAEREEYWIGVKRAEGHHLFNSFGRYPTNRRGVARAAFGFLSTVVRGGNSIVVSIPREELEAAGVQIGDQVLVTIQPAEIQPGLRADLREAVATEIELSTDAFAHLADGS